MSTTAYNARRLDSHQFAGMQQRLRERAPAAIARQCAISRAQYVARMVFDAQMALALDPGGARIIDTTTARTALAQTNIDFMAEARSSDESRHPDTDVSINLGCWLDPTATSYWLVLITSECDDLAEAAASIIGGYDWSYWNDADRPEAVDEVDWIQRAASWRGVRGPALSWSMDCTWAPWPDDAEVVAAHLLAYGGARLNITTIEQAVEILHSAAATDPGANRLAHLASADAAAHEIAGQQPDGNDNLVGWAADYLTALADQVGYWGSTGSGTNRTT